MKVCYLEFLLDIAVLTSFSMSYSPNARTALQHSICAVRGLLKTTF